jgi:SAM-dependent methyltransferase
MAVPMLGALTKFVKRVAPNVYISGLLDCDKAGEQFLRDGPPSETLVDVGCGDGEKTMVWWRASRAKTCIGLEFVESEIDVAKSRGIDARKADLSLPWPVADGECDVVMSSQNIEHMHRTMFYAGELFRILRPGGRAIVLTENLSGWANIAALSFGWQPFSSTPLDGHIIGCPLAHMADVKLERFSILTEAFEAGITGAAAHVCVLAYRGLRDVMQKTGFEILGYGSTGYAPFWGAPSRFLCRIDPRHGHFLALEARKPF